MYTAFPFGLGLVCTHNVYGLAFWAWLGIHLLYYCSFLGSITRTSTSLLAARQATHGVHSKTVLRQRGQSNIDPRGQLGAVGRDAIADSSHKLTRLGLLESNVDDLGSIGDNWV